MVFLFPYPHWRKETQNSFFLGEWVSIGLDATLSPLSIKTALGQMIIFCPFFSPTFLVLRLSRSYSFRKFGENCRPSTNICIWCTCSHTIPWSSWEPQSPPTIIWVKIPTWVPGQWFMEMRLLSSHVILSKSFVLSMTWRPLLYSGSWKCPMGLVTLARIRWGVMHRHVPQCPHLVGVQWLPNHLLGCLGPQDQRLQLTNMSSENPSQGKSSLSKQQSSLGCHAHQLPQITRPI